MLSVLKRCGMAPVIADIGGDLSELQGLVGGLIEPVAIDTDTDMICNEEGKILSLGMNFALENGAGDICDIICGDAVFLGIDRKRGVFSGLSPEKAGNILDRLSKEYLLTAGGDIIPVMKTEV